jgi:NAD(P)-dependent dehydrogenase (short-subunit alcohol dehydrogenase family)
MSSTAASATTAKKVILVTGANSGLGLECSLALAQHANTHVILAGRSQQRIDEAVTKAQAVTATSSIVEGAIVDLASLASVRHFANGLIQRDLRFFTIVCNAGVQMKNRTLTDDGFEMTVGVNHIAHFLLLELLRDRTQRILMISSETHDPAEVSMKPTMDMSDLDAMAHGTQEYNAQMFYGRSKLCNMLYTKEFARRFPDGPKILAYTPGFTPDTDFFREYNVVVQYLVKKAISLYVIFSGGRVSTAAYSGGYMARIASADA